MWFVYHQQKVYRKKTTDLSPVASLNIISHVCRMYLNIREYRRGNNNGQSRETGNIGYIRQRTMTNKKANTTQKTKMISNMDPTKKQG